MSVSTDSYCLKCKMYIPVSAYCPHCGTEVGIKLYPTLSELDEQEKFKEDYKKATKKQR